MTSIVSAYLGNPQTALTPDAIPPLVRSVMAAVREDTASGTEAVASSSVATVANPVPAVPVSQSVFPDHIVCLEDGKKFKMLKGHLKRAYQMTPEQYREKWGLPPGYPMTAPAYAEQRAQLARKIGLGRQRTEDTGQVSKTPRKGDPAVAMTASDESGATIPKAGKSDLRKKPETWARDRFQPKSSSDKKEAGKPPQPRKTRRKTTPDTQT
nr:MucR family transcriptional regulator [Komagataeibacter saccharivorans]